MSILSETWNKLYVTQHYIWFSGHFHIPFTSSKQSFPQMTPPFHFCRLPLIFLSTLSLELWMRQLYICGWWDIDSHRNYIFGSNPSPHTSWLVSTLYLWVVRYWFSSKITFKQLKMAERDVSFFPVFSKSTKARHLSTVICRSYLKLLCEMFWQKNFHAIHFWNFCVSGKRWS